MQASPLSASSPEADQFSPQGHKKNGSAEELENFETSE